MLYGKETIELKKSEKKGQYLYEAIKDGKVIATRTSNRDYVAALVSDKSTRIINGVGRMDLLPGALRNTNPTYIALLSKD